MVATYNFGSVYTNNKNVGIPDRFFKKVDFGKKISKRQKQHAMSKLISQFRNDEWNRETIN